MKLRFLSSLSNITMQRANTQYISNVMTRRCLRQDVVCAKSGVYFCLINILLGKIPKYSEEVTEHKWSFFGANFFLASEPSPRHLEHHRYFRNVCLPFYFILIHFTLILVLFSNIYRVC